MLKSYIITAFRNIKKHKTFSLINILGLSIGMTVSLLILIFVINEFSYDNFYPNKDRIYRIAVKWGQENNIMKFAGSMPAISPAINDAFPGAIAAARVLKAYNGITVERKQKKIKEENACYADAEYFKVFALPFISGNPETALAEPYSVVITKSIAEKYFGNTNPVGETLTIEGDLYKVTGLINDIPENTHLNLNMFISYKTLAAKGEKDEHPWNSWGSVYNYVLLKDNVSPQSLKQALGKELEANAGEWFASRIEFVIQNLTEIHWINDFRGDSGPKQNKMYVLVFLIAAIVILAIACFNYVNLSTARYLERMKDVGIRKVIGANRSQIVTQFLIESLMITFLSIFISFILFQLFRSSAYSFIETKIILNENYFFSLSAVILFMIIIVGFIAGVYPALFLSKFSPTEIIKNKVVSGVKHFSVRKVLVVVQFIMSILLIFGTVVIYKQIDFMLNTSLGYDKENVVILNLISPESKNKYQTLKEKLSEHSGVKAVSGAFTVPGINSRENMGVKVIDGSNEDIINLQTVAVDYDFVKAMGIKIIKGRNFSEKFGSDINRSVILNETAVKMLNINNPIGEKIGMPKGNNKMEEVTIVGVVKDFNLQSLHNKITPLLLYLEPEKYIAMLVKYDPESQKDVLAYINKTWGEVLPGEKPNYIFLEDSYKKLYKSETKTEKLLVFFAVLAIFISSLGLLGLTSFAAAKRVKEIGIRKVLGASVSNIVTLLSKEFVLLVVVSTLIASPVAYILMNKWLQNFAYRININVWMFLISGSMALAIALFTVSIIAIKAALSNPINSLRSE
ncbi:MAG: FtsX-like permease family protein [Chlorobi bacterium]|nr:FtsX-like permease family protein [Chlorobiota bacterium]